MYGQVATNTLTTPCFLQCKVQVVTGEEFTYRFYFKLIVNLFPRGQPIAITVKNDPAKAMLGIDARQWNQDLHGGIITALMKVPRFMLIRLLLSKAGKVCHPVNPNSSKLVACSIHYSLTDHSLPSTSCTAMSTGLLIAVYSLLSPPLTACNDHMYSLHSLLYSLLITALFTVLIAAV
jgi:hypothetical protein